MTRRARRRKKRKLDEGQENMKDKRTGEERRHREREGERTEERRGEEEGTISRTPPTLCMTHT